MKKIFKLMMALSIAAFTFTACEDVPEPYTNPYDGVKPSEPEVVIEPAGSGTAEDPWNVAAIIAACESLADGDFLNGGADVYVKGIVTSTKEISAQYGNATYYISDDENGSNSFYVYRGKLLDGASVTSEDDLKKGDEVTVCGKVKNYKGTMEFDQGNYLVSYNGTGGSGGGDTPAANTVGTKDAPKTVAEALSAINAMADGATSAEFWFVAGKVVKVTTSAANFEQYKNLNYLISADGTETNTITVYAGNGLDNAQFSSVDALKAGDEVVVYGQLQKYVNKNTGAMTPEIAKGNYLVKLTPGSGGGGDTPAVDAKKVTVAEFNAAAVSNDVWYELTGTVKNLKDGDQYGNFDLEDATGSVYVYGLLSEKGGEKKKFQELVAAKGIKEGSKLTIHGTRGEYNGKIEVMNAYFVSIDNSGSGDTPDPQVSDEVTKVSIADFNAAAVSNDVWYELTGSVKNLKDGDQYGNFDLEDATGSVYVYGLLAEKGGEKKKFQELVAAKGITEGCKLTIHGTRGEYNGKIEVMNAYFVSIEGGSTPGGGNENQGGEVSGNSISINAADFGFTDKGNATNYTLSDGTKVEFDKGEGSSNPAYYGGDYASVRLYAKNTMKLTSSKTIVKVSIETTTPSGGKPFNGNDEAYAEGGSKVSINKESDTNVSFSGLNAKTVTVVNDYTEAKGGTQLRIAKLTITYAE